MTQLQEKHLKWIKDSFSENVDWKYRAGAEEHGGTLTDLDELDLAENALMEAIDQVVYLTTLRDKIRARLEGVEEAA